jgi:Flp pilus assembly pilin Flp
MAWRVQYSLSVTQNETNANALIQRLKGTGAMSYLTKLFVAVRENNKGQTMTEYVLILAAIAVVGMTAYTLLGGKITSEITTVTSSF